MVLENDVILWRCEKKLNDICKARLNNKSPHNDSLYNFELDWFIGNRQSKLFVWIAFLYGKFLIFTVIWYTLYS